MFEYIEGKVSAKHIRYAVVDVGGVGYRIEITFSATEELIVGKKTRFYIHPVLRDDNHSLYGFLRLEERSVFRSLIAISSVGPKLAMNILGSLSVPELKVAVKEKNVQHLLKVPSIGNKMAHRLIHELSDSFRHPPTEKEPGLHEAEEALISLGYKPQEAAQAIERIQQSNMKTEELVRAALRDLAMQRRR